MSQSTAAKGVERENLTYFKCLQKWYISFALVWEFITLLNSTGLASCGIRGTEWVDGLT